MLLTSPIFLENQCRRTKEEFLKSNFLQGRIQQPVNDRPSLCVLPVGDNYTTDNWLVYLDPLGKPTAFQECMTVPFIFILAADLKKKKKLFEGCCWILGKKGAFPAFQVDVYFLLLLDLASNL